MLTKTKTLIVDDHPVFRSGLRQLIESDGRFSVVAEASNADEAIAKISEHRPDIAVIDIDLPQVNGLQLAGSIRKMKIGPNIVILTSYKEESLFNAAMDEGVKSYILKENAATDIINGLRAAASGEAYISPTISGFLLRRGERRTQLHQAQPELARLTPTERRILKLIAENKTSREIGKELFISHRTVETHRANICEKLALAGAHPLLEFALRHKSAL
jgi:DNA-binding NarL/FixJ family response regulator